MSVKFLFKFDQALPFSLLSERKLFGGAVKLKSLIQLFVIEAL
ncbi:MAG: hypothetical protein ACE5GA_03575 [Candidatus Zixiibacteriota bacterium]